METCELVSNLMGELEAVRVAFQLHEISEDEAKRRIAAIRRRARSGDEGYLRPQRSGNLFMQQGMV
jgi:hypothetical protein